MLQTVGVYLMNEVVDLCVRRVLTQGTHHRAYLRASNETVLLLVEEIKRLSQLLNDTYKTNRSQLLQRCSILLTVISHLGHVLCAQK